MDRTKLFPVKNRKAVYIKELLKGHGRIGAFRYGQVMDHGIAAFLSPQTSVSDETGLPDPTVAGTVQHVCGMGGVITGVMAGEESLPPGWRPEACHRTPVSQP